MSRSDTQQAKKYLGLTLTILRFDPHLNKNTNNLSRLKVNLSKIHSETSRFDPHLTKRKWLINRQLQFFAVRF